jgi:Mycothiol maleylpyruvate isomerase N-terminal domain
MPSRPARTVTVESAALMSTLGDVRPDASTACSAWSAHDIVAHLAAGAKEHADLIEHHLSGRPERGTRGFEERELPFRALDHDTLMGRLVDEIGRKQRAYEDLAASEDPSIAFTGTRLTEEKSELHSRSEAALHRWDITGDDDTSQKLLSQPDLASHAVWALDNMPVLNESAQALGSRAATMTLVRVVFRAAGQPDILLTLSQAGSRFQIIPEKIDADLVLTMRPDHRPLVLWGRKPAALHLAIDGDRDLLGLLEKTVWSDATVWPPTS